MAMVQLSATFSLTQTDALTGKEILKYFSITKILISYTHTGRKKAQTNKI